MINLTNSRFGETRPMPVVSANGMDEGLAMVLVDNGAGESAVKPSEGVSGEIFFGFSIFERRRFATMPKVLVVEGTGQDFTVQLSNYIDGTLKVTTVDPNDAQYVTADSAGEVTVTADLAAGVKATLVYTVEPTAYEVMTAQGDTVTLSALDVPAECGCILKGEIFTSAYRTEDAWVIGAKPKLGANGFLTLSGSGEEIPHAIVTTMPNEEDGEIGITLL